jgi:hypothetical protein
MEVSTVVFEADSDTLIDCTTGVIVPREQELVIEKELPTEDSAAMPYCMAFIRRTIAHLRPRNERTPPPRTRRLASPLTLTQ